MLRYDGPVIRYLAKAGDMILLNVLWVLCSLPIVTFGAATAAAHYVALKFVRDEGTSAASMFFRAFRRNLRQGCVLGLISLAGGGLLGADLWLVLTGKSQFSPIARLVMMGILWLLAFLYVMVMIYVWAVMARFENTVGRTVFNSIVMAIANIKSTVMMICWDVSLITVTVVCVGFFPQAAAVLLLFGFPSLFILNAVRLRPILDQCGQRQ